MVISGFSTGVSWSPSSLTRRATSRKVDVLVRQEDVMIACAGVRARVGSILYEGERYAVRLLPGYGQVPAGFQSGAPCGLAKTCGSLRAPLGVPDRETSFRSGT
ncbi:hypothetical protein BN77_4125 [Rhizobium mesoamericanum STM3625]|uniref:Uncharacterized protein n=1 Tax=Rhizobium mesoamericanum STM3625 TaxID=1211777 RepID=K0PZ54_9HYPH|nr:hypothetical protein BN77_4125 [Rhizobium mesoamericanum STM3625]